MRHLPLLGLGLLAANSAYADLGAIPKQSGWSGFLLGGINVIDYQSNFYSGNDDHSTIAGLNGPQSSSTVAPLLNADIRYTFADTRTQLFLGNLIQDAIRFDFTQQLGLRQELGDKGIVGGSAGIQRHANRTVERSIRRGGSPQLDRYQLHRGTGKLGQNLGQQLQRLA